MIIPLHIQDIKVGEPILVQVRKTGIAAPPEIAQPHLFRYVNKPVRPDVLVENAWLGSISMEMSSKTIAHSNKVATPAFLIDSVLPNIGQKQIHETIPVVVKKYSSRRVPGVCQSCTLGDFLEPALAQILKQRISSSYCCDIKIRISIIVDIRK